MTKYLKTAPQPLVKWHREKTIGKGRDILERLVTDPAMNKTWNALQKRVRTEAGWPSLFREIIVISRQAKKRPQSRQTKRDEFLLIANRARRLAAAIAEGPLDLIAYELFPDEVMATAGVPDWSKLDHFSRLNFAYSRLSEWPSIRDLLCSIESRALTLAQQAMTERRLVERHRGKSKELYFVRALATYFKETVGSPLYGAVTDIATVGLRYDVDLDFVKKAIQRSGT